MHAECTIIQNHAHGYDLLNRTTTYEVRYSQSAGEARQCYVVDTNLDALSETLLEPI